LLELDRAPAVAPKGVVDEKTTRRRLVRGLAHEYQMKRFNSRFVSL